jgi:hypothetical protein
MFLYRINNLGLAPGLHVMYRIRLEVSQLWCVASSWA